jgi:hypothetical protein
MQLGGAVQMETYPTLMLNEAGSTAGDALPLKIKELGFALKRVGQVCTR